MTESDEARAPGAKRSLQDRGSRLLWATVAVAILVILLSCAVLVLIAATQG